MLYQLLFLVAVFLGFHTPAAFQLYGINYSARKAPIWSPNRCKSATEIDSDMALIKTISSRVRIYSLVDCNVAEIVLASAERHQMQVWLGIWESNHTVLFEHEQNALERLLQQGMIREDIVLGIHVGSEAIYRKELTPDEAIINLEKVRSLLHQYGVKGSIPLTIADTGDIYLQYPQLVDAVDIVSANSFPFWEKVRVHHAVTYLLHRVQPLIKLAEKQGKEFMIGETGWASAGAVEIASSASDLNQKIYFQDFYCRINQGKDWNAFYFSAFDNDWKIAQTHDNSTVEAHFGVFTAAGVLKPHFQDLHLRC